MVMTAGLTEVSKIIGATHGNPHNILGLHEIQYKDMPALAIRVFIPLAKTVFISDTESDFIVPLQKIHADGFFEAVITERNKKFDYELVIENEDGEKWHTHDPYAFEPVLTNFDLQLIGEGTHYEIYNKLGAHPMSVNGIDGVLFTVWAPNAKRVSVIGSFNNWDGRRAQMRILQYSGIWELFIPGLSENDRYKFEIMTYKGQVIQKSDPYGNYFELRPSTSAYVCDINKYEWADGEWLEARSKGEALDGAMNIYEMHIGSWKYGDDGRCYNYRELADELIPYVKDMGYNYVQLMPVTEYPFDGSWGYQVTGYYAPTSRYGSPSDFMYFIDKCHQSGIGVILDWVPSHFANDAHGLARFDGSAVYEHEDPRLGAHPQWGTLIFNYGRKEVKNFLIGSALFWLDKYHLDGLRVNGVSSMLYLDFGRENGNWVPNKYGGNENLDAVEFIKHMNSIIAKSHPGALIIAEETTAWEGVTRPVDSGGLGFSMKRNAGFTKDFLSYVSTEPIYRRYHHNNLTFSMIYAYSEKFVLTLPHDEVIHGKHSLIDKMPGDLWQKCANLRLSYGFICGHPGKKLLFMGGEFGQFIEWDDKRQLDWFLLGYEHHRQIHEYVRALNNLYMTKRALWFGDFDSSGFEWIDCNDYDRSVISFMRSTDIPEETLIFVCNFTPVSIMQYRVGVPYNYTFKELLNSDAKEYGGSGIVNDGAISAERTEANGRPLSIEISVPPLSVVILGVANR